MKKQILMKHLRYKILMLFILVSTSLIAQKQVVYQKSYDVNKNSTLNLDITNTTVGIEHSTDGKIHFDYGLEFENYSKKEIKEIIDGINIKTSQIGDHINLEVNSITKINRVDYSFKENISLVYKPDSTEINKKINKKEYRKSKDSLLREIRSLGLSDLKKFFKRFSIKYDGNKEKKINTRNIKIKKSRFSIKVPPNVNIKINGNSSQITFLKDIDSEVDINLDNGFLRAKSLTNSLNQINVKNAVFEAEKITGTKYMLNNVSKCLIGEVANTVLETEVSRIEIGEIQQNVEFNDFNSEYFFYNYAPNFNKFSFKGQYSKVHFHESLLRYTLKVFGNNTVFHMGDKELKFGPKKDGLKSLMLKIKKQPETKSSGNIDFDIVNGIMYVNILKDMK